MSILLHIFDFRMNKTEQKEFTKSVTQHLRDSGTTIKWFLEKVGISRTHWHFLKKGERPLSDSTKTSIMEVLKSKIVVNE